MGFKFQTQYLPQAPHSLQADHLVRERTLLTTAARAVRARLSCSPSSAPSAICPCARASRRVAVKPSAAATRRRVDSTSPALANLRSMTGRRVGKRCAAKSTGAVARPLRMSASAGLPSVSEDPSKSAGGCQQPLNNRHHRRGETRDASHRASHR